ncbi:hypothetical protein T265_08391 [Opisthorchis viverrini]|uniref:Uncharacterized protein n=1 Tax=Opisthorchis viverrini TaxID=6198 RepID=A0A074ZDU4_OPIVI|nr:hypothetical protein T265_08391 [Opisthorchis viverrini]KER23802.1 hypothetical protein T265_08391 [Opisthorchis viverrini]
MAVKLLAELDTSRRLPNAPTSDVNSFWDEIATPSHIVGSCVLGTFQTYEDGCGMKAAAPYAIQARILRWPESRIRDSVKLQKVLYWAKLSS